MSRATIRPACMIADAVAQPLGLVEVVGGQQDGHRRSRPQPGDEIEQLVADARIEPDGRLVEEEHLRLGEERPGDLQPPALAAAVGRRPAGRSARPGRSASTSSSMRSAASRRSTPHSRAWISRLRRPVSARSTTASWNTTRADRRGPRSGRRRRRAGEPGRPAVGTTVVVSMPIVVDLPAPFGPEQAEHLAGRDVEVDAPHGFDAAGPGLGEPRTLMAGP